MQHVQARQGRMERGEVAVGEAGIGDEQRQDGGGHQQQAAGGAAIEHFPKDGRFTGRQGQGVRLRTGGPTSVVLTDRSTRHPDPGYRIAAQSDQAPSTGRL